MTTSTLQEKQGYKETSLGYVPEEWNIVKLKDICLVKRGASPRPIKDPKWWGDESGWVRISDVTSSKNI